MHKMRRESDGRVPSMSRLSLPLVSRAARRDLQHAKTIEGGVQECRQVIFQRWKQK